MMMIMSNIVGGLYFRIHVTEFKSYEDGNSIMNKIEKC